MLLQSPEHGCSVLRLASIEPDLSRGFGESCLQISQKAAMLLASLKKGNYFTNKSTKILFYQSVGIVSSENHHVNRRGVIGHADPCLGSVLNIVVGDHSGDGATKNLQHLLNFQNSISAILYLPGSRT